MAPQVPCSDPTSTHSNSTDPAVTEGEICSQSERDCPQHSSTCPKCQEAMNRQFDDVLRAVMLREGWTEEQVNAVSLRGFAKRPMADLAPDPAAAVEVQRHVYARNCVEELQARIDATREIHEARINAIKGEESRQASDTK